MLNMITTITKDFQKQLLHVINMIEKIEDLCKEEVSEPFGPWPDKIDYNKVLQDSKKLTYTDGLDDGISHMARKILRIIYG
jgi:hypothetical protein